VLAVVSDKHLSQDVDANNKVDFYFADVISAQDYWPFGSVIAERQFTASGAGEYRFGFNGMEADPENVNQYDYGARIYNPLVGRFLSVDPLAGLQAGWSPFRAFFDNPIAFVDNSGGTEFYFNGRWIGTDGVNNGLIAIVRNRDLNRQIAEATSHGKLHTVEGLHSGTFNENYVVVHKFVLERSFAMLSRSLTQGRNQEFAEILVEHDGSYRVVAEVDGSPVDPNGILAPVSIDVPGDVSTHSHPTGIKKTGGFLEYTNADQPSPANSANEGDIEFFKRYKLNIIVGLGGNVPTLDLNPNAANGGITETRAPQINVYDSETQLLKTFGREEAMYILSGERGDLGKKFKKHRREQEESNE
jgi:RHS repeat-associated protein